MSLRRRGQERLQRASRAIGPALAAEMFASVNDQRVVLAEKRRIKRKTAMEELLNRVVRVFSVSQIVAFQNAAGVSIDDEDGMSAGVEKDRIGGFRADAVDREELFAEYCRGSSE